MHASEQRRFLEGLVQRQRLSEQKIEEDRIASETPAAKSNPDLVSHKQRLKQRHKQARQEMLDDINQSVSA